MRNTRVGPGICTWIMGRKLKNMEYETQTLYDLECAEKTE
ncbi:hypothetical protein T06_9644 [Trichinella sp. T6]|nr:hypothetical protein T06_9644 [Trichinella sp. T6]